MVSQGAAKEIQRTVHALLGRHIDHLKCTPDWGRARFQLLLCLHTELCLGAAEKIRG
jgi:hypothetical protein